LTVLKERLHNSVAERVRFEFWNFLEILSGQVTLASLVQTLKPIPQAINLSFRNWKEGMPL
jgi:hypothetical protein